MQYDKIGLYIRSKREQMGLSLNEFALDNDIDPAILSRIENQKQGIKLNILIKISKGFLKTPAEFLTEFENSKF